LADLVLIVTAHNEAERLAAPLDGLARAFPGAAVWVADDGSTDDTPRIAQAAGARGVAGERRSARGRRAAPSGGAGGWR
jgi:glycosyltransferase involved in cell wall biosynthesis